MITAATLAPRVRTFRSEWIAFVGSTLPGAALAIAAAAGVVSESSALAWFAISFVGLNLMHMGATWARVYVRPAWRQAPLERLVVPLGLAMAAVAFEAIGGGAALLTLQYFLSFHHALMQNYGLVRASQRRDRRLDLDSRLDLAATLLLPGAALLYRANAVCDRYSGAPLPAFPAAVILILALAGAVALAVFIAREWREYRRGGAVDPIGLGIMAGTNLMWCGLLVTIPHPAIPLYAFASAHYIQYLYFVWHAEQRDSSRAERSPLAALQRVLRSSVTQYVLVLLILGGVVTLLLTFTVGGLRAAAVSAQLRPATALDIPPWAAAMIGINLEHYWLDRRIWRSPK